jgi:hypothetical protein
MSWEKRARGGRYYTRSRREGGRIMREYFGAGEVAELVAQLDDFDRDRREGQRIMEQLARSEAEAREAPIKALHESVEVLVRGALLAAGYHRHHGGAWRRKRGN